MLTPAGSVKHRLPSSDSGFGNLKLAGDWTSNGIDGGCVEAAVISGMDAARAITSEPRVITGGSTNWLQPAGRELPPYVEFGGRATAPAPFECKGGRMLALLLQGDHARMSELVDRMFNVPAGGAADYRALGSMAMMLIGSFDRITSLTPPFDRWGAVRETQVSFWIPVLGGRDFGHIFIPDRLVMAVPYVLVDNPMSYLGGRETAGYAKTMGQFAPADGRAQHVLVRAFGGDFGRSEGAEWRDFLEIQASGSLRAPGERNRKEGPGGLLEHLGAEIPWLIGGEELIVDTATLTGGLLDDFRLGRGNQVFLKQFRDVVDGTRACYQAVTEAPVQIQHVATELSEFDWTRRRTSARQPPDRQGARHRRPARPARPRDRDRLRGRGRLRGRSLGHGRLDPAGAQRGAAARAGAAAQPARVGRPAPLARDRPLRLRTRSAPRRDAGRLRVVRNC